MEIQIIKTASYRDGGTISIETNIGTFCIDGRIKSPTKGMLFNGYPSQGERLGNPELEFAILRALTAWKNHI